MALLRICIYKKSDQALLPHIPQYLTILLINHNEKLGTKLNTKQFNNEVKLLRYNYIQQVKKCRISQQNNDK